MAYQCAFFFGGIPAEGGGNFTLLPGIEPSTAILRFQLSARLPQIAPLVLRAGSRAITFRNCRVSRRTLTGGENGRWQEVTILDRRWAWADSIYPISGEYNRLTAPFNQRTDSQLAELLMRAMLESRYNINALRGASYTPVAWDAYNAPVELDRLCKARGMFPTLGLNDEVTICIDGVGYPPQNTPQAMDFTESAELPIVPRQLILEGGQTSIQHDLKLVPVAQEIAGPNAGKYIHIDSLTYRPPFGWGAEDPVQFPTVAAATPQALAICKRDVWKIYAVGSDFQLPVPPQFNRLQVNNTLRRYFNVAQDQQWRVLPLRDVQLDEEPAEILGYYALRNAANRNNTGDATVDDVELANPDALDYDKPIAPVPVANKALLYGGDWQMDYEKGHIIFDEPVYFRDALDGYVPAVIRLRTSFPFRDPYTAAVLCQQYILNPGSPVAVNVVRTIKESNIYFKYRIGYSNTAEFTAQSLFRLSGELQSYKVDVGASVPYKGFYFDRSIDGIARSMSFDVSDSGVGTTHVDYNMERPEQYLTLRELRLRREVTFNLFLAEEQNKKRLRGLIK